MDPRVKPEDDYMKARASRVYNTLGIKTKKEARLW